MQLGSCKGIFYSVFLHIFKKMFQMNMYVSQRNRNTELFCKYRTEYHPFRLNTTHFVLFGIAFRYVSKNLLNNFLFRSVKPKCIIIRQKKDFLKIYQSTERDSHFSITEQYRVKYQIPATCMISSLYIQSSCCQNINVIYRNWYPRHGTRIYEEI